MFRQNGLNVALNVALSVAKGHTSTGIVVPHHLNHHVEAGSENDWIKPGLAGVGLGWIRIIRYVLACSINMMIRRRAPNAPQLPAKRFKSQRIERIVLIASVTAMLLHDWRVFLVFNLFPWLAGLGMLVAVNLFQHDGCKPGMPLGESRDFTGRLGNWLFFNNGYHSAHHFRPAAHWTELPALHARLMDNAARGDLQHGSILAYAWKFGWSRTLSLESHDRMTKFHG